MHNFINSVIESHVFKKYRWKDRMNVIKGHSKLGINLNKCQN